MKISLELTKVSLAECRKIINTKGVHYTDEEVMEIRDWLYHIIDIILDVQEQDKKLIQQTHKQAA
jgi:hypothetical protein